MPVGPNTPFTLDNSSSKNAKLIGLYLEDSWKLTDKVTLNYGARFDYYDAYVTANQLSPRVGLVYAVTPATTLHAGYARYFTPPPTELIGNTQISQFANTTAASEISANASVVPERSHYFDVGISQKFGSNFTVGLDAYYKQAQHLLDEGQFGQALIFAPFNYEKGWVKGIELTFDYHTKDFNTYANLAISQGLGKQVESGQYNFGQDEIEYIASHSVHLDHDQLISGSVGANYNYKSVKYGADVIYGSGLRSGFANSEHLPFYATVNLSVAHQFDLGKWGGAFDSKLSALNLFDRVYQIRDGSGIGVFAPQYAARRGVFLELSKSF